MKSCAHTVNTTARVCVCDCARTALFEVLLSAVMMCCGRVLRAEKPGLASAMDLTTDLMLSDSQGGVVETREREMEREIEEGERERESVQ